jgi:hypothetical protein
MPVIVPIISTALNFGLYVLGSYQNPEGSLAATGMLLASIPVYYIFIVWLKQFPAVEKLIGKLKSTWGIFYLSFTLFSDRGHQSEAAEDFDGGARG